MAKILAVIPARSGSKRIKNKNIKSFLGKEIISYPITELKNSRYIDDIIVSTDSEIIKEIALSYGASVPFMRSKENSDDYSTTYDVVEEVINNLNEEFDLVCCVYPTSVFVTSSMLDYAVEKILSDPSASSIVSILEYSHPIQRSLAIKEGYLLSNNPECYNMRSQDLTANYHDAAQFYIVKPDTMMAEKKLITSGCIPFIINSNDAQDIDTIDDWSLAELKYKLRFKKV